MAKKLDLSLKLLNHNESGLQAVRSAHGSPKGFERIPSIEEGTLKALSWLGCWMSWDQKTGLTAAARGTAEHPEESFNLKM